MKSGNGVQAASGEPKKKMLHGVPVEAWILSRKNAIAMPGETPAEASMRVFVQCHELKKKGPEFVGKQDCESLLAVKTSGAAQNFR